MFDEFHLPVRYINEELLFPAQLQQSGYMHRFRVDVYGLEVFFEPDEEGSYRALIDPESINKHVTVELLQAIAEAIETAVK
jgi:hypothetical protein